MATGLRAGLVGGGPWARRVHAPALGEHPDFELVGIWTRRGDVAAELARAHGARAFDSLDALIDAVDVLAIAVPPSVQPDVASRAARAGCHLVLEKPLALTLDAARRLGDEVAAAGVASVVALVFRYAPATRGWLADVAAAGGWAGGNARWLSGGLLGGEFAPSPWRQQHGALLDIGPHVFDVLDAGLGDVVAVRAASVGGPDLWHVVCAHDGGATSATTLSMRMPVDPPLLEFDVYGSAGRLTFDPRRTPATDAFATMLTELAANIRSGERTHPCDVHRGVHLQWVIDQANRLATR